MKLSGACPHIQRSLSYIQEGRSEGVLAALIFMRAVATLGVSSERCLSNTLVVSSSGGMLSSLSFFHCSIMKRWFLDLRYWYVIRALLQSVFVDPVPSLACLSAASFPGMSACAFVHLSFTSTPLTCIESMSSRHVHVYL